MGFKGISDFRSDTVTRPTTEMRKAMYNAEVGDDVHGDDPTVNKLEELAARKLGKESSLFVPSGTMGNTIAMILAAGEGKVVLMEEKCHIINFESGNVSRIARSLPRVLPSNYGEIPLEVIEANLPDDALREHIPETKAISLENTHNIWGGSVLGLEYMENVHNIARKHRLHMHLDGARIFNAAVALNKNVKKIAQYFDSVMFCLSKGLSAPIGSMLVGTKEFIGEARKVRKYLGGGMRQVGVIAAAGIVALEKMTERLIEDHIRAKNLAQEIAHIEEIEVSPENTVTNFVMIKLKTLKANAFLNECAENKVLALPYTDELIRFVIHKDINNQDINRAIKTIRSIF